MPTVTAPTSATRRSAGGDYTARHLSVLEGLEAVRKRPGMYIGSTDGRGLMHCLWEIIDNSVDEALADVCRRIDIRVHADGSVEVHDDGRGIPVDAEPKTGLSGVEVVFTKLHAGGKFGGGSYAASGGLHGVGASVVNALSSRLDVHVERSSKVHSMSFRRGEPGIFADAGPTPSPDAPFEPFVDGSELLITGKARRGVTGTRVRYWADRQIFLKDAVFAYDELVTRLRQTSYLVPGLTLVVRDERGLPGTPGADGPHEEVFVHEGGITEYVDFLATDHGVTDVWRLHGIGHFHETVPVLDERGHMTPTELERECLVDVALRWGTGYDTHVRSFVNIIATPKGGTHAAGFEAALLKTFRKQVELNARRLKAGNDKLEKDDVLAGLTAIVTVRLAEPQFEGQTKEVLGTNAVRGIVARVVEKELTALLISSQRGQKQQSALLLEKVVAEMKSRISARLHKETQRRKSALETSSLPAKLADCRTQDVDRSELFIVEGDSALGTAKLARSSDYQALLPTLFFRYMRPLVDAGRVYAAVPPLHRVEVVNPGTKKNELVYTYSEAELRKLLGGLAKRNRRYKGPIQRYKGLGEMDADQLAETTMDPRHRTLRRVTLRDAEVGERVFELLMGNDVAPRKDFIVEGADALDRERIDA